MNTPPALDIKHLLLLRELAETGSMVEAAERLHVSPSALTHRLREAERRLGVLLAVKRGRRLLLTRAGARLAHTAQDLLQAAQQSELEASRLGSGITNVVRLASGFYNEYHWLPELMKRMRGIDPGVLLEVVPEAWNRPLAALEAGTIDIAVLPAAMKPEGFNARALFKDELVLLVANSHPLANRGIIEVGDLKDQTYIAYWFSSRAVRGFENDRFFLPAKVRPSSYMTVESLDAVKELVAAGLGVTIVSKWALQSDLAGGQFAHVRLTKLGLPLTWFAVTRDGKARGTSLAKVLRELSRLPFRLLTRASSQQTRNDMSGKSVSR